MNNFNELTNLLADGKPEAFNAQTGAPYTISGVVVHGRQVGSRILNMPTANVRPPEDMLPLKTGVYITTTQVDGRSYASVTNLGVRPTFAPDYLIESFLLDFSGDLYGKTIEVAFLRYIRPERKFDSFDALKTQIEQDAQTARAYFIKEKE